MIGRTLRNRYRVEAQIGEGSTATVYRAWDLRLERTVALKMLLSQVKDTTRRRFLQEAKAIAQFTHPGIMAIYDADEDMGASFLVVEYVEGETLAHYVPSSPETVAQLGAQIADALHYAHTHGVIHRDIKPANIMVTLVAEHIKIMDLGLALARDAKRVTADGMVIGTPAYLSPEQAQGLPLDHRTDIYSLGVVLYEMVTGQLPFTTDDISALMLQHVQSPPPSPRSINPDIPEALERVLLKALEKAPDRRFSTAETFSVALSSTLQDIALAGSNAQNAGQNSNIRRTASASAAHKPRVLRLVIADDHQVLRSALANYLAGHDDFIIVGEASDGAEAVEMAVDLQPDVLLLDLNMPTLDGLAALPLIRSRAPDVKVLILTGRTEDWYITQALRRGAHGYLLKSNEQSRLVDAIRRVVTGSLVLGEGVVERVVSAMQPDLNPKRLTEHEHQIVLLLAISYENDAIAQRLGVPLMNVIESIAGIMNKLSVRTREMIPMAALRRGDILLEELHAIEEQGAG